MTEETKTIISNIIAGVDITPENLLIAKQTMDAVILDDKSASLALKNLQKKHKELLSKVDNAMQDYIKVNGEIPFNDGKDKEYYLRDKSDIVISDDDEYRKYLKELYPLLVKQVEVFDEDGFEELYKNGSITDAKALAGVTTTVTTEVKSRIVKKSKKAVAEEGGDE